MKRTFLVVVFGIMMVLCYGQTISVADFRLTPNDMTAMQQGTSLLDQNGERCALIKIETTQNGFTFDVGSLGIVKQEAKAGEIWLYVPYGIRKMSIGHPQLGFLRDYPIPCNIEKGRTYIMKLVTGEVQTVVKQSLTSQYVVFNVTPANAMVEIDGQLVSCTDGVATKLMPFGTYDYRVIAPDCESEVGKVTVNDAKQKAVVNIRLKSTLSSVTVTADKGTEIWVNNDRKGVGTWSGSLGEGEYLFEGRRQGYRTYSVSRHIGKSETVSVPLQSLQPIYGSLNISSNPQMSTVYLDGKQMGETPLLLNEVLTGPHKLKLSKSGYSTTERTITITENKMEEVSIELKKGIDKQTIAVNGIPFTVNGVSFTMIPVEGGTFMMGATPEMENPNDNEKPVHEVTVSNFAIGQTEVTQALWKAVMGKNPSYYWGSRKKLPVESVSWNDCQEFIEKLSALTGKKFRLPTEAEWEFAARGGNKSNHTQYSGSNNIKEVTPYYESKLMKGVRNVATRQPNELGIYDMSGNVWEWCSDWYGSYSSSSQTNPTGPTSGSYRVCRGGCWASDAGDCRSSSRSGGTPDGADGGLGLRLVYSE